ncbi:MAG: helix-turn-helix transcriptional regulator [Proteobacteria bacterium]|nr:helix-turn-helix transcriptional regulator [Pseudomonadota bacterium]
MNKSSLPTPECIRAARAYLDISQGELGEECGLSRNSIASIEKGIHANSESLEKIQKFFWEKGVEFRPDGGFRTTGLVEVLEGDAGIISFFSDVAKTAELYDGEFLVNGMDEVKIYNILKRLGMTSTYSKKMNEVSSKVTYRAIVSENIRDQLVPPYAASYCTYKAMPNDQVSTDVAFYIYGDKLAIMVNVMTKIIIIKDSELVEAYRRTFNVLWNSSSAKPVYTK